jgi:hypothetical protein
MDIQRIIASLDTLRLEELRQVRARANELIAHLEARREHPAPAESDPSYQAYRDMKAHAPEDLGKK